MRAAADLVPKPIDVTLTCSRFGYRLRCRTARLDISAVFINMRISGGLPKRISTMTSFNPRPMPLTPAIEAPVHVLGLQGASVVIVDDQETARIALDHMVRGIDPGIATFLFAAATDA